MISGNSMENSRMEGLKVSVVVPVYNGAETITELFERIRKVFTNFSTPFQVVFVEDCGKDNSWEVLCLLKAKYPAEITAIKLNRNFGQHNATMCGLEHADGDLMVTIDDDLQIFPEDIPLLVKRHLETGAELVYGSYGEKNHNSFRNLGSLWVNKTLNIAFGTKGSITSFRLITRNLRNNIIQHRQSFVFLDGLFNWHTSHIEKVLVRHGSRMAGSSGYTIWKLISLSSNMLFNFTTIPLKSLIYLGLIISLLSFLSGFYFILRKIIFDVPVGFTSIIVSIFFMGGLTLLVLGVIGEYIGRLYTLQNSKPQHSVKEIL
jgi:glycosyltransferase involved in cell wall biosynthesis